MVDSFSYLLLRSCFNYSGIILWSKTCVFPIKTYMPNESNENFVQAIEFLFFALSQAELNNIDLLLQPVLEELRIEVSRNLTRLVADLPEHDPED